MGDACSPFALRQIKKQIFHFSFIIFHLVI